MQPELASRLYEVMRSIDNDLNSCAGLRAALNPGHVPFGSFEKGRWIVTPIGEGLARYGAGTLIFSIWLHLRDMEALRYVWTGQVGAMMELPRDEPDEAPGLTAETPEPADVGTEDQQRLSITGEA